MDEQTKYDEFAKHMENIYPEMFGRPYGGFAIGEGWWRIIEALCANITSHTKWRNQTRAKLLEHNEYDNAIPDEVPQVVVHQIKEKFGGLRFYFEGGDNEIHGMVRMAEAWAACTCEDCGKPGIRRSGGWIRTLCDEHENERQEKMKNRGATW